MNICSSSITKLDASPASNLAADSKSWTASEALLVSSDYQSEIWNLEVSISEF